MIVFESVFWFWDNKRLCGDRVCQSIYKVLFFASFDVTSDHERKRKTGNVYLFIFFFQPLLNKLFGPDFRQKRNFHHLGFHLRVS